MAEASRRAARPRARGGLENALFVVAAAERPPAELAAIADEVTILLPWGSLLRGALARDDAGEASAGIASLVAPGGSARILVSVDPRDGLGLAPVAAADADDLARRWAARGLALARLEPASSEEVAASGSTWARRLSVGHARQAWWLELRRIDPGRTSRSGPLRAAARLR
jgi:16S rRNA (adenine(1408)-N(1))-methyltransferase